jgi:hypothetical protein
LVLRDDPTFQPNGDCARDWLNIAVGIVWQVSIFTTPIYLVLRNWPAFWLCFSIFAITMTFLKFNWYDKLEKASAEPAPEDEPAVEAVRAT